ncbi:hypothetical protein QRX60_03555 [Amycolatopsis mongoliensis]|uniref:Uncharacterized protein n=1 Tax=Amycolatopsis mongoliensis TaxID=715475 RepID=A0A9Y2JU18_9PSEU|nr:hypothetical protein [Amycolatopsis sp. 4-36]WIY02959.1 hypothetical protein QRX60_03555 [Amycolatopsis sp. 4-36]
MLDTTLTGQPTTEQRRLAMAAVKRHAHDSRDETELMAMLGLDHEPAAPHDSLSATELFELFAPLADERADALAH